MIQGSSNTLSGLDLITVIVVNTTWEPPLCLWLDIKQSHYEDQGDGKRLKIIHYQNYHLRPSSVLSVKYGATENFSEKLTGLTSYASSYQVDPCLETI